MYIFCDICHFDVRRGQRQRIVGQKTFHEDCYLRRNHRRIAFVIVTAILVFLFTPSWANHEETGMFQGRTACLLNQKGEPVVEKKDSVSQAVCWVVGMPGYPEQAWVFVELPPDFDVQAVYLVDKKFQIIRTLWKRGTKL